MLCRCHIAQKCRSCRCCHGSANRRSNMVISRSNICHKWSQYIKRRSLTNGLLHFHICLDLIQRHMSRTFHHHLNILLPCPPGQFAQTHQLLDLADVRCICKTSWSACVTEWNRHIIFPTNIQNLIIIFIKWIFFPCHTHPRKYKRTTSGYDVHFSLMLPNLLDCFTRNATVQCHKIHSILCVKTDHIDKISGSQRIQIPLIVDHGIIDWNSTDQRRTLTGQLSSKWNCISMRRQIHDGMCAHLNCLHHLLHLHIVIFTVSWNSQIHIDLCTQHRTDSFRINTGVIFVGTDDNLSFCHQRHQLFGRHMFFLCHDLQFFCHNLFSRCFHLCCIVSHMHSFPCPPRSMQKAAATQTHYSSNFSSQILSLSLYIPTLALSKSGYGF